MDSSKSLTSWCTGNIWGLYSIILILLGVIASISAFPTGTVITQASLPEDDSMADNSPHSMILTMHYVCGLQKTLNRLCQEFVSIRFDSTEPPYNDSPILTNLPNIGGLLPNKILTSEDLPRRMWIHYRILLLFNRSMDNIIFDESQNNASHNFGAGFYTLQKKIEYVSAGILETIHDRRWEEDESVTINHNLDAIFENVKVDILRMLRDYTVLSYFNQYMFILNSDIYLL